MATKKNMMKKDEKKASTPKVNIPCFKCKYLHGSGGDYRCVHKHPSAVQEDGTVIGMTDGNTPIYYIGIIEYMHSNIKGCLYGQESKHDIQTA